VYATTLVPLLFIYIIPIACKITNFSFNRFSTGWLAGWLGWLAWLAGLAGWLAWLTDAFRQA